MKLIKVEARMLSIKMVKIFRDAFEVDSEFKLQPLGNLSSEWEWSPQFLILWQTRFHSLLQECAPKCLKHLGKCRFQNIQGTRSTRHSGQLQGEEEWRMERRGFPSSPLHADTTTSLCRSRVENLGGGMEEAVRKFWAEAPWIPWCCWRQWVRLGFLSSPSA